jgi:Amt family ammonium transporter
VVCYFFVAVVKGKLGYDDSLDAFGVHGIGGSIGAICTGLFAAAPLAEAMKGVEGGFNKQLVAQIIATLATWVFAGVMTFILVKVVDAVIGIRVSAAEEEEGLDISQHGEVGYTF